jgi:phage gpG-like protein
MLEFTSFAEAGVYCAELALAQHEANHTSLERATKLLQKKVKEKFGEYQPTAGKFVEWPELEESTQDERERAGYEPDEPLLREGDLRESIQTLVRDNEGFVGSNSDIAVWQELGTKTMPPRSFLGSAAVENIESIGKIVGEGVVLALVGEKVANGHLAIDAMIVPMMQPGDLGLE